MTLDEVIAALRRGHCTEAKAREAGCGLCVPRYEAIAQVQAWHAELETAQLLADSEKMARYGRELDLSERLDELEKHHWGSLRALARAAGYARAEALDFGEVDDVPLFEHVQALARLHVAAPVETAAASEHPMDRALRGLFPGLKLPAFGSAEWDRAAEEGIADEERRRALYLAKHPGLAAELAAIDTRPRHPPPTTFLALDGTETPIEEALRRAAEDRDP